MTKNFIIHGFYLLVVTSVAVMYNPHTNAFGFNPSQTYLKFSGISPFPVGSLVRRFSLRSTALRLLKVESDINGILPAGGGPLPFISFLS